MDEQYRLAILLSAYNGKKYIKEQIQSLLKQKNKKNITIIIRDDGSTDGTLQILQELQLHNQNLVILKGKNIGLVSSFFELLKYGIKEKYNYFAFCDQDDYWLPDKLYSAIRMLNKVENKNIPVLYGSCSTLVNKKLEESKVTTQKKILPISFYNTAIQNILPGHTQVINYVLGKILVDHFDKNNNRIYSQDLWITNVAAVSGKILFENKPHVLYRMHGNNELGYGQGKFGRLKGHIQRLKKNECKLMSLQLKYFIDCFDDYLTKAEKEEMDKFFSSQKNLIQRIKYSMNTKLYRQTRKETFAFKILYIFGAYNI